jgi:hypothetical protein
MGKRALGHQLYALGILPSPLMDFESVATDLMTGVSSFPFQQTLVRPII